MIGSQWPIVNIMIYGRVYATEITERNLCLPFWDIYPSKSAANWELSKLCFIVLIVEWMSWDWTPFFIRDEPRRSNNLSLIVTFIFV